jgi:hypothetical protein
MYSPPETVCGFPARYNGPPEAAVEASGYILLAGGARAPTTFLRWDLADFAVDEPGGWMSDGWLRTILVVLDNHQWHLSQGNSSFWSSRPDLRIESISNSQRRHPSHGPHWQRRSDRYWPQIDRSFLPFLGQGSLARHDLYLFGDLTAKLLAAHLVDRSEQNVEDHYDQEQ